MRRLVVALLGLLLATPAVRAEDDAPDPQFAVQVERYLKDLGSNDYATREAARKRLQGLAREARPLLEARRDDPDPEVRRTIETLLADLGGATDPETPAGELGRLGLVTFHGEGRFADVANEWERRMGGRLRFAGADLPGASADAKVKVDVEGVPWFEGLAALLRPAGLDLADGFDEGGQASLLTRDATWAPPVAYVGPFRLEVDSVTTTRSLRPGVRPRYSILLRLAWAPDVQVISFRTPEVKKAVDERGGAYLGADGRGSTYGMGGGRHTTMLTMSLQPEQDATGERLASLETVARIRVRHGREEVVFKDLAGEAPWPRTVERQGAAGKGPARVVLGSFGPDPDRSGWVMGVLTATLPRGVTPESVFGTLETSDGNLRPMLELSSRVASSDGVLRLTLRAGSMGRDVEPVAVRVVWYETEQEVTVPFVLKDVPLR
jgi:hypothetical protein